MHRAPGALGAKLEMRRKVLEAVSPARVFDACCASPDMWAEAWRKADSYVGCDRCWSPADPRPRFCGDQRRVMRSIDLGAYNVFDVDAYTHPWDELLILTARRTWEQGELGGLVITDALSSKTKAGNVPKSLAQLIDLEGGSGLGKNESNPAALFDLGLSAWIRKSRVTPLRLFRAEHRGDGKAGRPGVLRFAAIVFSGA